MSFHEAKTYREACLDLVFVSPRDWVGGCRGGILGVEGDTPYLIRQ